MSFLLEQTNGSGVAIDVGAKITSIAGSAVEAYIVDLLPYSVGMRRRARILAPVDIVVQPLTGISAQGAPQYGAAITLRGQVKGESASNRFIGVKQGADAPETSRSIYFNNTNQAQPFGVVRGKVADAMSGLLLAGLFTIRYLPPPTLSGGNPDLYIPSSETPGTPIALNPVFVSLSEQSVFEGAAKIKTGDALIRIPRTQLTEAQLQADRMLIEITPKGGSARMYQLWNSDGIKPMQTLHWEIYLKRVRP